MSVHPWFCEYCCHHDGAPKEDAPHDCMITSSRLTAAGRARQYICGNWSQTWERTTDGWRRWFEPAPLWEPNKRDDRPPNEPFIVPTQLG